MPKDFQFPPRTPAKRKQLLGQLLWTLHLDGPFEDTSGLASTNTRLALEARGVKISQTNLVAILADLEVGGPYVTDTPYVSRELNGRRIYVVRLAVEPETAPNGFPPNPFKETNEAKKAKAVEKRATKRAAEVAVVVDDPIGAPVYEPEHSAHDKLLFAISCINDAMLQLARDRTDSYVAEQLRVVGDLLQKNEVLRLQVQLLERTNAEQANTIDVLRQGANINGRIRVRG